MAYMHREADTVAGIARIFTLVFGPRHVFHIAIAVP